ncbi:MAG: CBS domain-containing protein [Acidobacteria bacterium]|nr:CBS domain-containing protein [Acidobacteriota bacterium]MCL5288060.1 CBS domain-containing protein [Acidobacteriota bacterium]
MKSNGVNRTLQAARTQELIYELKVQQAMTTKVITVEPENTMEDLRQILKLHQLSGTPVMNEGDLVGIVSVEDLIRSLLEGNGSEPVKQRMSANFVTLYADEPLVHAVQKFERHGFGRFPVIDRKTKELVGILTKGDIIRCMLQRLEIDFHEQEIRRYKPSDWFAELESDRTTLGLRYLIQGRNFQRAGEASSKLKQNLRTLGIAPEAVRRITIASYEAEMNLVIFTGGGELSAFVEPGKVTITVVDHGPGIPDIERAMQPGYSTAPDWVRELGFGAGMGLPNIKNCSNELKLDSKVGEGTNLQFTVFT